MKKTKVARGSVWASKFHVRTGTNGDVVLAKVTRVFTNGRVELLDSLTGRTRKKKASDLLVRNYRATEEQAAEILRVFNSKGRAAARELAVTLNRETT